MTDDSGNKTVKRLEGKRRINTGKEEGNGVVSTQARKRHADVAEGKEGRVTLHVNPIIGMGVERKRETRVTPSSRINQLRDFSAHLNFPDRNSDT